MRTRIVAAAILAYASLILVGVLNRYSLLQGPHTVPIRVTVIALGLLAAFVCMMYLVFAAISGAPDDESLARKYWAKWQMLIWVPWWCILLQKGIVEFRTTGFGGDSFLAALLLSALAAAFVILLFRRAKLKSKRLTPSVTPSGELEGKV